MATISKTVTILREFVTPFCVIYRYFCTKRRSVMNTDNKISRRDFIKTSVVTGGALIASTAIPGQAVMPHPIEGMRDCIVKLQSVGVSQSDIDLLVRRNPAWLIGLTK